MTFIIKHVPIVQIINKDNDYIGYKSLTRSEYMLSIEACLLHEQILPEKGLDELRWAYEKYQLNAIFYTFNFYGILNFS